LMGFLRNCKPSPKTLVPKAKRASSRSIWNSCNRWSKPPLWSSNKFNRKKSNNMKGK
jgi:hypothetical protein